MGAPPFIIFPAGAAVLGMDARLALANDDSFSETSALTRAAVRTVPNKQFTVRVAGTFTHIDTDTDVVIPYDFTWLCAVGNNRFPLRIIPGVDAQMTQYITRDTATKTALQSGTVPDGSGGTRTLDFSLTGSIGEDTRLSLRVEIIKKDGDPRARFRLYVGFEFVTAHSGGGDLYTFVDTPPAAVAFSGSPDIDELCVDHGDISFTKDISSASILGIDMTTWKYSQTTASSGTVSWTIDAFELADV